MRKLPFVLAALLLPACPSSEKPTAPDAAPPQASVSASVEKPAPSRAQDVDADNLASTLKCQAKSTNPACAILEEFREGKAWNLTTIQATEARYFGTGVVIKDGVPIEKYMFLVAKKLPLNEVEPGDLPVKIALNELDKALGPPNAHAPKLIRILSHDGAFDKRNQTANYVKEYAPSSFFGVGPTSGPSAIMYLEGGTFAREGKNRRLLLAKPDPASPGSKPGDGIYALLYAMTW